MRGYFHETDSLDRCIRRTVAGSAPDVGSRRPLLKALDENAGEQRRIQSSAAEFRECLKREQAYSSRLDVQRAVGFREWPGSGGSDGEPPARYLVADTHQMQSLVGAR